MIRSPVARPGTAVPCAGLRPILARAVAAHRCRERAAALCQRADRPVGTVQRGAASRVRARHAGARSISGARSGGVRRAVSASSAATRPSCAWQAWDRAPRLPAGTAARHAVRRERGRRGRSRPRARRRSTPSRSPAPNSRRSTLDVPRRVRSRAATSSASAASSIRRRTRPCSFRRSTPRAPSRRPRGAASLRPRWPRPSCCTARSPPASDLLDRIALQPSRRARKTRHGGRLERGHRARLPTRSRRSWPAAARSERFVSTYGRERGRLSGADRQPRRLPGRHAPTRRAASSVRPRSAATACSELPDESCDDGNLTDGDGCSAQCMRE